MSPQGLTKAQLKATDREWDAMIKRPADDVEAFARLVLSYVGPEADPMLDGDAELRMRARALLVNIELARQVRKRVKR